MLLRACLMAVVLCAAPARAQLSRISIVVDGERIVLSDGTRILLLGVDAPEKHPSARLTREAVDTGRSEEAVARQGEIAAAYLSAIALGRPVLIVYDHPRPEVDAPGGPYVPAIVYVADERGAVEFCLNERMIEDGYARVDPAAEFARRSEYEQLEAAARIAGAGLWAELPPVFTPVPVQSRPSEGADPLSRCRDHPGCVWVTMEGNPAGPGLWRSKPGARCPCDRGQ